MQPQRDVALAPLTTFRLGGKCRYFVEVKTDDEVAEALRWADDAHVGELFILGGGSNLLIADTGTPGLVIRAAQKGIFLGAHNDQSTVIAHAGEAWDDLVRITVERDLCGLECLSGIPGSVGATPIQNVGAYGQEIAQTLSRVSVFDRQTRQRLTFGNQDCALGYRNSRFKQEPDRYIVLSVEFQLKRGSPAPLRHRELLAELESRGIASPNARQIREAVLSVRAKKSMIANAEDPLSRSAGSFFVNPIVSRSQATEVKARCPDLEMPSWEMPDGQVKLAAAWLIEHSGLPRGYRIGPVGLSPHHCLVVVALERAEAADVVAFAHQIRISVKERFGLELVPEPRFWGFEDFDNGLPVLDEEGPRTLDSASWPVTPLE